MAKNQTLELSILIGGHVDNSLTQAVKSANTQLSSMANGASKLAANIAKVTVGIASGITAGLVDATKEAVAFESEMLDVTKYVGGLTDANGKVKTDAYAEMSKDILDLSTQIPYTAKELTRLAAAAGQSGKSMDDLISGGFLKDVAEMGTAMDISADQAGDWAAKWEVAFNMNHDQVMELADQINYLGAHYATTAAEIAQTVNDTGSLGQIAGMDAKQQKAVWSKDTCWDGKGNECAVWQHSAGTGFRRNNRIVERQFDRAIRSQSCKVCKKSGGDRLYSEHGRRWKVDRPKSCRYTTWRLCREHGPKGYGLWTRIAGRSKKHCRNGNWRRKKSGRPRSIY